MGKSLEDFGLKAPQGVGHETIIFDYSNIMVLAYSFAFGITSPTREGFAPAGTFITLATS